MKKSLLDTDTYQSVDKLIREGREEKAIEILDALSTKKIPREEAVKAASLMRRCGLHFLALKVLSPYVRPGGRGHLEPSTDEVLEYAASLSYLGGAAEALSLLEKIDAKTNPQTFLYRAFSHISQWDYKNAILPLREYVKSHQIDEYQKLVGFTNLAEALVVEGHREEATPLLEELIQSASQKHLNLVWTKALEISAQNFIETKDWKRAEQSLQDASKLLNGKAGTADFFVRKWRAFLNFSKSPMDSSASNELRKIRAEAFKSHPETARDSDALEAVLTKNEKLLTHVWFGTPFTSYRDRLLTAFPNFALPPHYDWKLRAGENPYLLDLLSGNVEPTGTRLKTGQLTLRLVQALASDFYRPQRVAVLHFTLFPEEFFNPHSSPHRIHQLNMRLKNWFSKAKLPMAVIEDRGQYWLSADRPVTVRSHRAGSHKFDYLLKEIDTRFPEKAFSASELGRSLNMHPRAALRALDELKARGAISVLGSGRQTKYIASKKRAA